MRWAGSAGAVPLGGGTQRSGCGLVCANAATVNRAPARSFIMDTILHRKVIRMIPSVRAAGGKLGDKSAECRAAEFDYPLRYDRGSGVEGDDADCRGDRHAAGFAVAFAL